MSFKISCPHCENPERFRTGVREDSLLSRMQPAHQGPHPGEPLRAASPVSPPPPPWSGAVENGYATRDSARPLPAGMPPMPPPGMPPIPAADPPVQPPSDPLAFLHSDPASPSPRFPAGMPPMPQTAEQSNPPKSAADLLAAYRSTSKSRTAGIRERLARIARIATMRGLALKLGHEATNLETAIDAQLEILGTLTLTHRPSAVAISDAIADLSQIHDGLSQKQNTLDSLRQTKGGGSVVKELNQEVVQLRNRQRAVMVAIGKAAWVAKAEMPSAAGAYAALEACNPHWLPNKAS